MASYLAQGRTSLAIATSGKRGEESELLDLLTDWIQQHYRDGGYFSAAAIASAGEAGRDALTSGYSLHQAFEAGRTAYFMLLERLKSNPVP